jgi:hypothetical protein
MAETLGRRERRKAINHEKREKHERRAAGLTREDTKENSCSAQRIQRDTEEELWSMGTGMAGEEKRFTRKNARNAEEKALTHHRGRRGTQRKSFLAWSRRDTEKSPINMDRQDGQDKKLFHREGMQRKSFAAR